MIYTPNAKSWEKKTVLSQMATAWKARGRKWRRNGEQRKVISVELGPFTILVLCTSEGGSLLLHISRGAISKVPWPWLILKDGCDNKAWHFLSVLTWDPCFSQGWEEEPSHALLKTGWQEIFLGGNCITNARQKGWIAFNKHWTATPFTDVLPLLSIRSVKGSNFLKAENYIWVPKWHI